MKIVIFIIVAIVIIAVISFIGWYIRTSNAIKIKSVEIEQSLANIDVSLAKRADTLKKQLDVTKSYAKHELETFTAVINLRKGMSVEELQQANEEMDEVQSRINAVVEDYPELRSSNNFIQLQKAINACEADLAATRRVYNSDVSEYNQMIITFPTAIVAKNLRCKKCSSFEASEKQRQDVEMIF